MSTVPQIQYEQLMGDFTTINLQLNETRNKLYDAERQNKAIQSTLTTTNKEFTKASTQLKKAQRTIAKSKDKTALSKALAENGDLSNQLAALKRVLQTLQDEQSNAMEEADEERRARLDSLGVDSPKPALPPRKGSVGLFADDGEDPFADEDDDDEEKKNDKDNAKKNNPKQPQEEEEEEDKNEKEDTIGALKNTTTTTAAGGDVAQSSTTTTTGGDTPVSISSSSSISTKPTTSTSSTSKTTSKISRRPSAVMQAMAKAQQDELLKLRSSLEKEHLITTELKESFQKDLSGMLQKVATKESELQAAKKQATTSNATAEISNKKVIALNQQIKELENQILKLSATNNANETMKTELRTAKQTISTLTTTNSELEQLKINSDEALAGFSDAHQDALAKVEKEKESQLREMSSDLKIEIQMLKDKFKIMTKERDDLLVTVNQATDIQTTLKQENVDKEEILEIMETEKNKLEKEIETNTIEFQKTKKEKEILIKERNALQIEHDALTATQNETASTLQETMLLHQKAAATIETHDQHVQKVTKKMDDKIVEHKIKTKRQKELIKDLKRSLLKETKKREDVLTETDALREKAETVDHLENKIIQLEQDLLKESSNRKDSSSSPSLPPRGFKQAPVIQNDDGVTAALAGRLEQLLTENVYVKEKIGMLESIVQDLTNDLADKRAQLKLMEKKVKTQEGKKSNHASGSATRAASPPNFNLGTVAFSSPATRNARGSTLADAVDEI